MSGLMFALVVVQAVLLALMVYLGSWWGVAFVGVMTIVSIISAFQVWSRR
jgi:hypothetical protein